MIDHAQATTNVINAAIAVVEQNNSEASLERLKRAVEEYKSTKRPRRIDDGDDFDSLHGCG